MAKVLAVLMIVACQRQAPAAVVAPVADVQPAAPVAVVTAPHHIDLVSAPPDGPVAPYIAAELARAKTDGRRLLVYVGATWCEPCQRFHNAAKAGQLDDVFGDLRLVEFDLDRDRDRLVVDGYHSEMIPLLALPATDGKSTGRGMQGSIKGDGAVAQMRPRLQALLATP